MKERIKNIIFEAVKEIGEEYNILNLKKPKESTELYGSNGNIDSLGLVGLITGIESRISDVFNIDVVIADEKAMSQRNSPFKNINNLVDYILKIISEETNDK